MTLHRTGICLNVNLARPWGAYRYVDMVGWIGGQAEYVMVPYAAFNCLRFPDRNQALEKILNLTMLSDIFPTGFHGAVTAGDGPGTTVCVAGAGPVGLACTACCHLLEAPVVVVGDMNPERLAQAHSFGCETIDLREDGSLPEQIGEILAVPEVDAAVDCVGFEARGHGSQTDAEKPAKVLNAVMKITRAGGAISIPRLYVTDDPGGIDKNAKSAVLGLRIGLGWAKSLSFATGQCPMKRYNLQLMSAILNEMVQIAKAVNAKNVPPTMPPRLTAFSTKASQERLSWTRMRSSRSKRRA